MRDAEEVRIPVDNSDPLHRDDELLAFGLVLVGLPEHDGSLGRTKVETLLDDPRADNVEPRLFLEIELADRDLDGLDVGRGLAEWGFLEDFLGRGLDLHTIHLKRLTTILEGLVDAEFDGRERSSDCGHRHCILSLLCEDHLGNSYV